MMLFYVGIDRMSVIIFCFNLKSLGINSNVVLIWVILGLTSSYAGFLKTEDSQVNICFSTKIVRLGL